LVIGCTVVSSAKVGVAIAVGFAFARRQFGPQGNEITIINYPSIQRRLLPALARTYVYDFALKHYTTKYQRNEAGTTVRLPYLISHC
jgi:acyl-CoA oxidase